MRQKIELSFKFKGDRPYVQGPDIYDLLITTLNKVGIDSLQSIRLEFHSLVKYNLSGFLIDFDSRSKMKRHDVNFSFFSKQKKYFVGLDQNRFPVLDRYPFPEEHIVNASTIDLISKSISLGKISEFSNIEKIVALNKKLLNGLFPEVNGKWYFTRLELDEDLERFKKVPIRVAFLKNLDFRLTKSSFFLSGNRMGNIYFSLER